MVAVTCFRPGRTKDLSAHPRIYPYKPRISHLIKTSAEILEMERVDSGFLNYVFILHTSLNNEPNDDIYLRQVKIFIHIHLYVSIRKTNAI